jgi:hypothetical protein
MAQFNFDPNSVPQRENNFDVLPAGWYDFQIVDSKIVSNANGSGIELVRECLTHGFRGRKVWQKLYTKHSNPQTETIAGQSLRELCETLGIARLEDTSQLHNKPHQAKLKIRKDPAGQYADQNDVQAVRPSEGGGSSLPPGLAPSRPASPPVTQSAAAPAAAGGATPPWAKKAA